MRTRSSSAFVICLFVCLSCLPCSGAPTGYDWMLERNGGKEPDTITDPGKYSQCAVQWALDLLTSLKFFTSELDSTDPKHVKTSIRCLAMLAYILNYASPNVVSAENKAKFEKSFPIQKLKKLLETHPEYDAWIEMIRGTKLGPEFPAPKDQSPKP